MITKHQAFAWCFCKDARILLFAKFCGPTRGEPRTFHEDLDKLVDRVLELFSKDPDGHGLRNDDRSLDVAA